MPRTIFRQTQNFMIMTGIILMSGGLFAQQASVEKHVIVWHKPGKAYGWPANQGACQAYCWGNEMLTGGYWGDSDNTWSGSSWDNHFIDWNTAKAYLSRSTDGGETWTTWDPENLLGDEKGYSDAPGSLDFTATGFAMRVNYPIHDTPDAYEPAFWYTYDKGETWRGPYRFNGLSDAKELKGFDITSRTDYIVNGKRDIFLFMSARGEYYDDRTFMAKSTDGAKTFQFVSWIHGPSDMYRSVMPSTVRVSPTHLVTALRRKNKRVSDSVYGSTFIDVYHSTDNGKSWSFISRPAHSTGDDNGNPPALIKLDDGRLVVAWGNRSEYRMYIRVSFDNGLTWDKPLAIRGNDNNDDDFPKDIIPNNRGDLGYPRLFQRSDGKVVCVYYWKSIKNYENHLAATIIKIGKPPRFKY